MKILLQAIKSLIRSVENRITNQTNTLVNDTANNLTKEMEERLAGKPDAHNLTITGSFSLGRNEESEVGKNSFAAGKDAEASGAYSHAEGWYTTASGDYSHTEGSNTTASSHAAHAEGDGTIASSANSHVQGKYNIEDTESKYAHIVGNGIYGARSNAHTVDWDGNAWFAGTVEGTALIISSPNGTRFKVTVDDNGTLSAIAITE